MRDTNENKDMCVTLNLNIDVEGSESRHHVLIFLCLNKTSVAAFISTVLDEPADEQGGRE